GRRVSVELCESCHAVAAVGREGGRHRALRLDRPLTRRRSLSRRSPQGEGGPTGALQLLLGQTSPSPCRRRMRAMTWSPCSDQSWILLTHLRVQHHVSSLRS